MAVLNSGNVKNETINLGTINGLKASAHISESGQSSLGGLPLISKNKTCMNILREFSWQIEDNRESCKVKHSVTEMVSTMVGMIACGYEDRNDVTFLKNDPSLKFFANIGAGRELPSQPTLSRFENSMTRRDLYNLGWFFVNNFINSYKEAPAYIVIDVDDSNIDTYGGQELTLFNGYYGEFCYMPLFIFEGQSGKLILPLLRPGRRNKSINIFGYLRRLFEYLHQVWPNTIIVLRGDAHFCNHQFMDWAHGQNHIRYITGLTTNDALNKRMKDLMDKAEAMHKVDPKLKRTEYHLLQHKMNSWARPEWVAAKIEIDPLGVSVRYIVTNMVVFENYSALRAFSYYSGRGRCELDIKNFKELHAERMSCHSFMANTFRLFLYGAAYVVIHTLRNEVIPVEVKKGEKRGIKRNMSFNSFIYYIMRTPIRVKKTKTTVVFDLCEHCYAFDRLCAYYRTVGFAAA